MDFPILEFDDKSEAIINPRVKSNPLMPEYGVMTFYGRIIEKLANEEKIKLIDDSISGEIGTLKIYSLDYNGKNIAVCCPPGIGAPLAAMTMEVLIAFGIRKLVTCGHGGVLRKDIIRDKVIIPVSAIRQEGVSYHYLPPGREVEMDKKVIGVLEKILNRHNISYMLGKTWTTDAFYRETKNTIEKRKTEGALTAEMEAASLMSVAKFRNIVYGQYIGAGDDISGSEWDPRYVDDKISFREKLLWLSIEACLEL
jgi:uridine phosphorylase